MTRPYRGQADDSPCCHGYCGPNPDYYDMTYDGQQTDDYDDHNPTRKERPMDIAMFERDLQTVVSQLPPKLLEKIKALVGEHLNDMKNLVPQFMALVPHIKVIAFEAVTGSLDTKELNDVLTRTLGVKVQ